jgi:membrane protease YdiL (CAAX protease family)
MTSVVKRHSLVTFFVLAYGLSWGNYILFVTWPNFPFLFPFGPFVAALTVASVTRRREGLEDLLSRSLRWRVGPKWYTAALLVPIAIALATISFNIFLGATTPTAAHLGPWYSLFLLFPVAMIDAPLWEETGWRGYAMPRFPADRSPLANTLILGVLFAAWHLPLALANRALAAPYLIAGIASAVVTNWVYYNAHESALLAILYHTAANTLGGFYFFPMFSGSDSVRLWWLYAAVYGVAAVAVVLAVGPNLQRKPHAKTV